VLLLAAILAVPLATPLLAQGGRAGGGGVANNTASPIVFNGLIVQDGKTKVSLLNPNTGDTKWVQVGKKFGSYTVSFQPGVPGKTADAVVLTLGASSQRITLQGSAEPSAAFVATVATLKTSLADTLARARSNPSSAPSAIQYLESILADPQSAAAGDGYWQRPVTFFAADGKDQQVISNGDPVVIINTVTGAASMVDPFSGKPNPDGSTTWTSSDTNGRVIAVYTQPATAR
jgi:hypothetical protein